MTWALFNKQYQTLNPEQKQAVDALEGPVMVIAGPGTGKTHVLTMRIANIIKETGAQADEIVALTFTESAAAHMRAVLADLIGAQAYHVAIHTFHGLCNAILQDYPQHFSRFIGAQPATKVNQLDVVRALLEKESFVYLKAPLDPFMHAGEIIKAISDLKREGFSPKDFSQYLLAQKSSIEHAPDLYHTKGAHAGKMKADYQKQLDYVKRNTELATLYEQYEHEMIARKLYDFDDMIICAVTTLEENASLRDQLQERFAYLLVDEHQDTNGAQNKFLELLCADRNNPNLFVVGDEQQAIFRFQGASIANFLYFHKKYPSATLINLTRNYRSTQEVLSVAHHLMQQGSGKKIAKPLVAQKGEGSKIVVESHQDQTDELLSLAKNISGRIHEGADPKNIAVIVRENKELSLVGEFLEKEGIPFSIESDRGVLFDPYIIKLTALFCAVTHCDDDQAVARALHADFLNIEPLDVYTLLKKDTARQSLMHAMRDAQKHPNDFIDSAGLARLYELIIRWKRYAESHNVLNAFDRIARESGFLAHILAADASAQELEKFSRLFDEARKAMGNQKTYRLSDFCQHLELLTAYGVSLQAKMVSYHNAVHVLTAHKSKGLEFDMVYIPNVVDGVWGNKRSRSIFHLPLKKPLDVPDEDPIEDERRLLFVAITRAKSRCTVSYAKHNLDGREKIPSEFIGELLPQQSEFFEKEAFPVADRLKTIFSGNRATGPNIQDERFVQQLFDTHGISPTAFNNYLECPWKFFYNNLLRIPSAKTLAQSYGTAVHYALKILFSAQTKETASKTVLLDAFLTAMQREPFPDKEKELWLNRGNDALLRYYDYYYQSWNFNALVEKRYRVLWEEEHILLTGVLDKIERSDSSNDVVVVDYKTGEPQSRNKLMGQTKDAQGNYYRQLVFYKLLLELDPKQPLRMNEGIIDFVEPNQSGKFKKESFIISSTEVDALKQSLVAMAKEVRAVSFWNKRCQNADCSYCALRDMMEGAKKNHF